MRPDPVPDPDVQRLVDLQAISRLKASYFRLLDGKQWPALRALFTDDAVFAGVKAAGQAADDVIASLQERLAAVETVHYGFTPEIAFRGPDRARSIWPMFDLLEYLPTGSRRGFRGYGYYLEEYRKLPGGWRISYLRLTRLRKEPLDPAESQPTRGNTPAEEALAPGWDAVDHTWLDDAEW